MRTRYASLTLLAASAFCFGARASEEAALREAKEGYKIQMQYQGQYADENKDLRREYEQEKAQIKKRYQAANSSAPQDLLQLAATSPQGNANAQEQAALRGAKEGYKIQMQYQGQYADEAKDLRREYEEQKARIEKRYHALDTQPVSAGIHQPAPAGYSVDFLALSPGQDAGHSSNAGAAARKEAALREELRALRRRYMQEEPLAEETQGRVKAKYQERRKELEQQLRNATAARVAAAMDVKVGTTEAALREELRALRKRYMQVEPMAGQEQGRAKAEYRERLADLEQRLRNVMAAANGKASAAFAEQLAAASLGVPACSMLIAVGLMGAYFGFLVLSAGRKRCARRRTGLREGLLPPPENLFPEAP